MAFRNRGYMRVECEGSGGGGGGYGGMMRGGVRVSVLPLACV